MAGSRETHENNDQADVIAIFDVRAAGGVISRDAGTDLELLIVHRPRYDDWTFPKGKAESDETDEQTAHRRRRERSSRSASVRGNDRQSNER